MQPTEATSQSPDSWNADALEQSLEVANFLDAMERIITRMFGVAETPIDNEDIPTDTPDEEE